MLSTADSQALQYVAEKLGVPVDWLSAVINFETAGTWDPQKKNPLSTARGLIQFLDDTARGLGYRNSLDLVTKHSTIASQLRGPVLRYFQQWKEPPRDKQDFYFRVFLPELRKAPQDTVIYATNPDKQAKFRKQNPGIITVGDYYRKLEARFAKYKAATEKGGGALVGLAVLGFFLSRFLRS